MARQSFARSFKDFSSRLEDFDWAARVANLLKRNGAGAIDAHGRLALGIEHCGFDTMRGRAGVEYSIDAAVEIVQNVRSGGWADVTKQVGAGRGHRHTGLLNERECDGMSWHADANEWAAGCDVVGD